jgi:CheY-like chemotaxis protein
MLLKKYILSELTDIQVFEAVSAGEGLKKLELDKFDVVVCGNKMSETNGAVIYKKMLEFTANKETPFIILTSYSGEEHLDELEKQYLGHYLKTPFSAQEFAAKINSACNPRAKRSFDRINIPDTKAIIHIEGQDIESQVVNISSGGILVDMICSEEYGVNLLKRVKIKIELPNEYSDLRIPGIGCRILHLTVTAFNDKDFPCKVRVGWQFVEISEQKGKALEEVFKMARKEMDQLENIER